MPDDPEQYWENAVSIHDNTSDTDHEVTFDHFEVNEVGRKVTVIAEGDQRYIVTINWVDEDSPKMGENPFILTIHWRESLLSFPPVPNVMPAMTSEITSSGHTSMGDVQPIYDVDGKYNGTLVFDEAGQWTVSFELADELVMLGTATFNFTL